MKNIFTILLFLLGYVELQAQQPCTPISNIVVSGISTKQATVTWNAVSGVIDYTVGYKPTTSTKWQYLANTKGTKALLTGLSAGTDYNVAVSMANCSSQVPVVPSQAKFPTPACSTLTPSDVKVSNISYTTATVSWNTVIGEDYDVEYRIKGSSTPLSTQRIVATKTLTLVDLKNLMPTYAYQVAVKAACSGTYDNPVDFSMRQCLSTLPPAPNPKQLMSINTILFATAGFHLSVSSGRLRACKI